MAWTWMRPGDELLALSKEPQYAGIVKDMTERVTYRMAHFDESAGQRSGWAHNYVCPQCGGVLLFELTQPQERRCSVCGAQAPDTRLIREAWMYFWRYTLAETLVDAAILYTMEPVEAYKEFILRVVQWYADHYHLFPEYGLYAGRGKVMGQSLDEAVWGLNLLKALLLVRFDGKSEQGQALHQQLFLPVARLVMAQTGMIHNIPLWHMAYAVSAGFFFDDATLLRQATRTPLGLVNQIMEGFTPDGIWFENATSYHYYALEAASNACLFARWAGHDEPELFARVANAYIAFAKLRFRDDTLPSFNDCSRLGPDKGLRGMLSGYLRAARLFADQPEASALLGAVSRYDADGTVGGFLYGGMTAQGDPPVYGTVFMPHNRLGMLRSDEMEVFFKYGNLHRSHAHPDGLEICIPPFSLDLGTSGYGSPYHSGWYTQTLAHNTFLVDGESQRFDAKGEADLSADGARLSMSIGDAYPDVDAQRELRLDRNRLEDRLQVSCKETRTIDWVFHAAGKAQSDGRLIPAELGNTGNGYDYLTDVQRVDGGSTFTFVLQGQKLTLSFEAVPDGATLYLAASPDNPADQQRHTVLLRAHAADMTVKAVYTLEAV